MSLKRVIGVDLGGTKILTASLDGRGEVLDRRAEDPLGPTQQVAIAGFFAGMGFKHLHFPNRPVHFGIRQRLGPGGAGILRFDTPTKSVWFATFAGGNAGCFYAIDLPDSTERYLRLCMHLAR